MDGTISNEIWKPIPGYDGYQASSLGRIRSHKHRVVGGYRGEFEILADPARILKVHIGKTGYHRVGLSTDSTTKTINLYVLVLLAFKGAKPEPSMQAAHWDGNKDNNSIENLRWATVKENIHDKRRHGTHNPRRGEQMSSAKIDERAVLDIRKSRGRGVKQSVLASKYGITQTTVSEIENRKTWRHVA